MATLRLVTILSLIVIPVTLGMYYGSKALGIVESWQQEYDLNHIPKDITPHF